jgi:ferredoxin-NADP reductase
VGARGVGARDVGSRGAGGAVGGPVGAGGLARGSTPALLLIAGGSGITPLMAIARTVLAVDPEVRVALVYGNRSVDDIIFLDALDDLARAHGARFHVVHALEHPIGADVAPARAANFAEGRLDAATFERLAATLPPGLRPATAAPSPSAAAGGPAALTAGCPEIYLCGPAPMMAEVRGALASLGVAPAHIHEESFLRPEQRAGAPASTQVVLLRKRGVETHAVVPGGKTLLEAGLAAGVDMPYSCAMGGCAACKVKLVAGEVDMEEPNCLDPAERDAGFVLGCVARPKTPCVVEVP